MHTKKEKFIVVGLASLTFVKRVVGQGGFKSSTIMATANPYLKRGLIKTKIKQCHDNTIPGGSN
jgi:hypothetical protein